MKKLIVLYCMISFLFSQDLTFTNNSWRDDTTNTNFQFSINYSLNNAYHLYFEKEFKVNKNVKIAYGGVFSNKDDLGSVLVRENFPIFISGRAFRGEVQLNYDKVNVNLGRHLYDQDPMRQNTIWNDKRLTGDGINWTWDLPLNFSFENTIESLPTEKDTNKIVFNRILNYHALKWKYKKIEIEGGEVSIYTGDGSGIDLLQSNPFLPYFLNMLDSYDRFIHGYRGDNENFIITFKFKYNFTPNAYFQSQLYLDEFQIDAYDRGLKNDNYLILNELYLYFNNGLELNLFANTSDLAFGWHYGPFTDMLIHGIELLPHEFGEIYRYGMKAHYRFKWFEAYAEVYSLKKAIFDRFDDYLYLKTVQNTLAKETTYRLDLRTGFYVFDNLALWSQVKYQSDEAWMFNFIVQTYF